MNATLSPGAMLRAELKKRGLLQKQFAEEIGLRPSHLSEIMSNKRPISQSFALRLQEYFGILASLWLDAQVQYNLAHQDLVDDFKAAEQLQKYDEVVSVKTLVSRCCPNNKMGSAEKVDFLRDDLDIDACLNAQANAGLFRRSESVGTDIRMIKTWIILAQREVKRIGVVGEFNISSFCNLTQELVSAFHNNVDTITKVTSIMSKYGIRFCVVSKVDRASVDGYSFIDKGVPCIVVTKRFDRIDNLAYAVMHEVCHVYRHLAGDGTQRINIDGSSLESKREEDEANDFAANALIPEEKWSTAPAVKPVPYLIQKMYTSWARSQHLNKWIVLGRIAHETGMYKFKADEMRSIN